MLFQHVLVSVRDSHAWLRFGPWPLAAIGRRGERAGNQVDLSIFLSNEEWDLISMNVTRKREFYNYGYFPILSYSLKISRKSGYENGI